MIITPENPIPITKEGLKKYPEFRATGFGTIILIGGNTLSSAGSSLEIAHNDLKDWYCYFRNFGYLMANTDGLIREPDDFVLLRNNLKYEHEIEDIYESITGKKLIKDESLTTENKEVE